MKNLRTIVTVLVIAMTAVSCQTNDELLEENVTSLSNARETLPTTVEILVEFKNKPTSQERKALRDEFEPHLTIISYDETCGATLELWVINYVTYDKFREIALMLGYLKVDDHTQLTVEEDDGDPKWQDSNILFYYGANCSSNID